MGAYFELHAVAVLFAEPARLPAELCLRTAAEEKAIRQAAAADAKEAAARAKALRRKVGEMRERVNVSEAEAEVAAFRSRGRVWALEQPEARKLLERAQLLVPTDAPPAPAAPPPATAIDVSDAAPAPAAAPCSASSSSAAPAALAAPLLRPSSAPSSAPSSGSPR